MPMTVTGKIHKLSLREQLKDYTLPESCRAPSMTSANQGG
jgi:hypothetical protein